MGVVSLLAACKDTETESIVINASDISLTEVNATCYRMLDCNFSIIIPTQIPAFTLNTSRNATITLRLDGEEDIVLNTDNEDQVTFESDLSGSGILFFQIPKSGEFTFTISDYKVGGVKQEVQEYKVAVSELYVSTFEYNGWFELENHKLIDANYFSVEMERPESTLATHYYLNRKDVECFEGYYNNIWVNHYSPCYNIGGDNKVIAEIFSSEPVADSELLLVDYEVESGYFHYGIRLNSEIPFYTHQSEYTLILSDIVLQPKKLLPVGNFDIRISYHGYVDDEWQDIIILTESISRDIASLDVISLTEQLEVGDSYNSSTTEIRATHVESGNIFELAFTSSDVTDTYYHFTSPFGEAERNKLVFHRVENY